MRGAAPDRLAAGVIARHVHARPYATIVLEGAYEEAGDHGRFRVSAGGVLFHGAFSTHQDVVGRARTVVSTCPKASGHTFRRVVTGVSSSPATRRQRWLVLAPAPTLR
jgi:hypothetical protein